MAKKPALSAEQLRALGKALMAPAPPTNQKLLDAIKRAKQWFIT